MKPPRLAERLLARWVPRTGAAGPAIPGDLAEEYRALRRRRGRWTADAWYVGQVLAVGGPYRMAAAGRRIGPLVRGLGLDVRAARRSLARTPGLVAVGVLSLALGTGLTSAAVTLVDAIWFAPLPWPDAHRLVDLEDTHPVEVCAGCSPGTSYAAWHEWRQLPVFDESAAFEARQAVLTRGESARSVRISAVAGDGFGILGLPLALGRGLTPGDAAPDAPPAVVLTHDLWTSAFGADPGVVGRTTRIDTVPATVVGVLAPDARPLDRAQAFVAFDPATATPEHRSRTLWAIARLAPGVDVETADAAVSTFARDRFAADPALEPGWSARAVPLREVLVRGAAEPAVAGALLATTLLVLLLTTANLASLLVARVTDRESELGLRAALGAGRLAVARAAAVEAGLLAGAGGLLALIMTAGAAELLGARFGSELPGWITVRADLRLAAAAVAVTVVTAAACSGLPLLRALRIVRPSGAGAGRSDDVRRLRVHDALLGLQVFMGVILVAGSLTAVASFVRVSDFDSLGHRWQGLTNVLVVPATAPEAAAATADDLREAFAAHPAVESAAVSRTLFLGTWGSGDAASPLRVEGHAEAVLDRDVPRHSLAVAPGYFDLFEIRLRAGRVIDPGDRAGAPGAVVASVAAARALWPELDAAAVVGRRLELFDGGARHPFTVVGIVDDVVANPGSESRRPTPRLYTALAQTPPALLDATPGSVLAIHLDLREGAPGPATWRDLVARVAPAAVVQDVTTVEAGLRRWIQPVRTTGLALGGLATLAVFLLALGVYGTMRHRLAATRRETGIRLALGADAVRLTRAVAGRPGRVVAVALSTGLAAAPLATRAFPGGLPLGSGDVRVLVAVAALVGAVAAAAAWGPLRRAARLDPATTLRAE